MARNSVVLPAPFGPSTAHELSALDRERDIRQHDALAIGERDAIELDRVHEGARDRARSSASS